MEITGTVESLVWDERAGKLKLTGWNREIWIDTTAKPELKDLKLGDNITIETRPGRFFDFFIRVGKAVSQPPSARVSEGAAVTPKPPPKTSDFNIPYSYKKIGPLYPMLVDQEGNILDGLHRHEVDPDWPKVIVHVESRKDFLVKRIHANLHRRTVPKEERQKEFTELANILINEGAAKGELASKISELTGFDDNYVRNLLPQGFKLKTKPKGAPGRFTPSESLPISGRQPETLPDKKVDLEAEAAKRVKAVDSAAPQEYADLYTGPCPACGVKIQWDQKRKIFARVN